ncbi:MAG: DUF1003 domain-containing protein [Candidatus Pacearchaeota archaeon]|jgi:uncharacterized membrane protein
MKKEEKGEYGILHFHLNEEHPIFREKRTLGQKAADLLTTFAGSWIFIFIFFAFLILWMIVNTAWILFGKLWDPYPFILLNLALSCLAAIQAPIILMSQNREAQKDRIQSKYDYAVNRKAEKEIQIMQEDIKEIKEMLTKKKY